MHQLRPLLTKGVHVHKMYYKFIRGPSPYALFYTPTTSGGELQDPPHVKSHQSLDLAEIDFR